MEDGVSIHLLLQTAGGTLLYQVVLRQVNILCDGSKFYSASLLYSHINNIFKGWLHFTLPIPQAKHNFTSLVRRSKSLAPAPTHLAAQSASQERTVPATQEFNSTSTQVVPQTMEGKHTPSQVHRSWHAAVEVIQLLFELQLLLDRPLLEQQLHLQAEVLGHHFTDNVAEMGGRDLRRARQVPARQTAIGIVSHI